MNRHHPLVRPLLLAFLVLSLAGCQKAYYATMEKFGVEKRDILVDRVEDARESQQEAKQQFESALAEFMAVTNFQGGELEERYNRLKDAFEDSETRAEDVHDRIAKVESVAEALFAEWKAELEQYSNASLRQSSAAQLQDTRSRYTQLIGTMKKAEQRIEPVLNAFRDRVLFLKHNLNAQAIGSLKSDAGKIQADVSRLIREMQASISEADSFIKSMSTP